MPKSRLFLLLLFNYPFCIWMTSSRRLLVFSASCAASTWSLSSVLSVFGFLFRWNCNKLVFITLTDWFKLNHSHRRNFDWDFLRLLKCRNIVFVYWVIAGHGDRKRGANYDRWSSHSSIRTVWCVYTSITSNSVRSSNEREHFSCLITQARQHIKAKHKSQPKKKSERTVESQTDHNVDMNDSIDDDKCSGAAERNGIL